MFLALLAFAACTSGSVNLDTDTADTDPTAACPIAGTYGAEQWSLEVRDDCTAQLSGFCGDGEITTPLPAAGGHLSTALTWNWQGAGPNSGSDPATLTGTIGGGVVDGTLAHLSVTSPVYAVRGDPPGAGLGVAACELD